MMEQIAWIRDFIYILPIAGLIWKASAMAQELKELRKDVDFAHDKIRNEEASRDTALDSMRDTVEEIKLTVVEIKTKLEERKDNKRSNKE